MKIKVIKKFPTGSRTFFNDMFSDFTPHDNDYVCILDYPLFGDRVVQMNKNGKDSFFVFNYGKDKLIDICIKENTPMAICKFLSPEFAEYLNLTIDDLKKLNELSTRMDDKHYYLKMIYDFYIENNGFYLTDEQLNLAYQEYKSKRN